jgi:hypothetical protein
MLVSLQNNRYSVRRQLVSELQHFPETSSSSISMAGGRSRGGRREQVPNKEAPHHGRSSSVSMVGGRSRGGRREQVPNEEAPHHDRNVQDMMIEDLQRQVAELA